MIVIRLLFDNASLSCELSRAVKFKRILKIRFLQTTGFLFV